MERVQTGILASSSADVPANSQLTTDMWKYFQMIPDPSCLVTPALTSFQLRPQTLMEQTLAFLALTFLNS